MIQVSVGARAWLHSQTSAYLLPLKVAANHIPEHRTTQVRDSCDVLHKHSFASLVLRLRSRSVRSTTGSFCLMTIM